MLFGAYIALIKYTYFTFIFRMPKHYYFFIDVPKPKLFISHFSSSFSLFILYMLQ